MFYSGTEHNLKSDLSTQPSSDPSANATIVLRDDYKETAQ